VGDTGETALGIGPRHVPVLLAEVLEYLTPRAGGTYCDGTVGGGGHAEALLAASAPDGALLGVDRDGEALAVAAERLRPFGARARLAQGDYRDLAALARAAGLGPFDGILLDLGVSSLQLDDAARGFSFGREGPLDMRMDRAGRGPTAGDLLRRLPPHALEAMLREYGEERWARRIARALVAARARAPMATTTELADLVARAIPRRAWPRRIHPATRTFQALRIAVNRELEGLEEALEGAASLLAPGGRLAVISFHSLEDRAVKTAFRRLAAVRGLALLTRRPVIPATGEVAANPRARSAKLRAIRRPDAA
jgi:16S rRNA (cytosine1402-N4)-methyltransferase